MDKSEAKSRSLLFGKKCAIPVALLLIILRRDLTPGLLIGAIKE